MSSRFPENSSKSRQRKMFVAGAAFVASLGSFAPIQAAVLPGSTYEQTTVSESLYSTTLITGAQEYWKRGYTGKGVDVAVIDTGVTPVNGLIGKVINGPDLSFESQDPARRYKDNFGHGTVIAGIIAGKDDGVTQLAGNSSAFIGMAPDARIVNVKVGDGNGVADVSQVIAAVDWVTAHKTDNGMNIKVLELAYSTDTKQDWSVSPLTHALENAWAKGITVVVAAGNDGRAAGISMPAADPFLIAVGAANTAGTLTTSDDSVANYSSTGKKQWEGRGPDFIAPGSSIPSLRVEGSKLDTAYPAARIGSRFFRGSGTSQASAVVAGAVALIAQERPTATPDDIKGLIKWHATWIANETVTAMGQGEINLAWTLGIPGSYYMGPPTGKGTGSIDQARGSLKATLNGVPIGKDTDIFGQPFNSAALAQARTAGTAWNGGTWNGSTWSGSTWSGNSWSGSTWSGSTWSGNSWSGSTWSGSTWSGSAFASSAWSTGTWG